MARVMAGHDAGYRHRGRGKRTPGRPRSSGRPGTGRWPGVSLKGRLAAGASRAGDGLGRWHGPRPGPAPVPRQVPSRRAGASVRFPRAGLPRSRRPLVTARLPSPCALLPSLRSPASWPGWQVLAASASWQRGTPATRPPPVRDAPAQAMADEAAPGRSPGTARRGSPAAGEASPPPDVPEHRRISPRLCTRPRHRPERAGPGCRKPAQGPSPACTQRPGRHHRESPRCHLPVICRW